MQPFPQQQHSGLYCCTILSHVLHVETDFLHPSTTHGTQHVSPTTSNKLHRHVTWLHEYSISNRLLQSGHLIILSGI